MASLWWMSLHKDAILAVVASSFGGSLIFQPPRDNYKPLTEKEEEYFHLVNCLSCFDRAIKILDDLDDYVDKISVTLQDAATRLAIIEYAKA
ncbi:hypothetical protein [Pseudidiomarina mangrovi]|uniref:hypothetical protein n=1 Tax=Pseudidiomarina mangrovi TaxID=2487133 RepID=UPI000FCBECD0|nr:hypothetical protein [Pseudidiomarina mangrovi]